MNRSLWNYNFFGHRRKKRNINPRNFIVGKRVLIYETK